MGFLSKVKKLAPGPKLAPPSKGVSRHRSEKAPETDQKSTKVALRSSYSVLTLWASLEI